MLVVGEAPGANEDTLGRPFVGQAGDHLRQALSQHGLSLDKDAITTNALICRPPNNRIADPRAIDYCRPNLLATIERVEPRVVVALGKSALASVLGPYWKDNIVALDRWIGWQIPLAKHWICPTWHPSYLLRIKSPLMDRQFGEHLNAAFRLKDRPPAIAPIVVHQELSASKAARAIAEMEKKGGWVAVDYETNCIKPEYPKAKIVSCAISNGKQTMAFPWFGEAIEAMSLLWRSKRVRKIASNLKFEDRWTRHFLRHRVVNWGWDTMLSAHCLDNRTGICSLKFQSFVRLGIATYNDKVEPYLENRGIYNRIHEIALPDLLEYNGMDAGLEYKLAMLQRKDMGYED